MFAPYCPTCRSHRLLGYGRVVRSNWEHGGPIALRCHCGTIVEAIPARARRSRGSGA